ncbi:MAG: M28 family peptidase [Anaerolineae bacterium]
MDARLGKLLARLRDNWLELALLGLLLIVLLWLGRAGRDVWERVRPEPTPAPAPAITAVSGATLAFDGLRAQGVASFITALGARVAGSEAHAVTAQRIVQELNDSGWQVEVQEFTSENGGIRRNIVAKTGTDPLLLLATHYDTSPITGREADPARRSQPSPGANDGASGVAVLLELAKSLDKTRIHDGVWLVFLDGQYAADGTPVAEGTQALATAISQQGASVRAAVLVDLLGGSNDRFSLNPASDAALAGELMATARSLSYEDWFAPAASNDYMLGQAVLAAQGIPTAVLAGQNYLYWQTTQDTLDKLSSTSLLRVGRVLEEFIYIQSQQ